MDESKLDAADEGPEPITTVPPGFLPGNESEPERTVVIQRVFDVPVQFVFEAHTRPEHVLKWFGPVGFPLALCEIDFRVGGKFRFAMQNPKGELMTPFGGEYLEIEQDRKISYTNGFELPNAEQMVTTLSFEEQDGKTKLTMKTVFSSINMKQNHLVAGFEQGVGSSIDQLRDVAAALALAQRP
jgi:uncharacterized protein YndB with AHSA1/START domain